MKTFNTNNYVSLEGYRQSTRVLCTVLQQFFGKKKSEEFIKELLRH